MGSTKRQCVWSTANRYGQARKLDVEHVAHVRQHNIDEASHEMDKPGSVDYQPWKCGLSAMEERGVPHDSLPPASALTLSRPQIIPRRKNLATNLAQVWEPVKDPADMAMERLPLKGVGSEEDEGNERNNDRCKSAANAMEAPGRSAIEDLTAIQPQFRVPGIRRRGIRPPMMENIRN